MINISLNDESFRYDVHSMVKAFYPEKKLIFDIINEKFPETEPFIQVEDWKVTVRVPKEIEDRTATKNIIKRRLYSCLSEKSKRSLPWGSLTGIRPIKIPLKLLREGKSQGDILRYMEETYLTSPQKAELSLDIAKRQLKLLEGFEKKDSISIYIGIPFCPSICAYCSFSSYPYGVYSEKVSLYLDALKREIDKVSAAIKDKKIISLYIGGGTPTSLNEQELMELVEFINYKFNLSYCREFCVECGRPDSITREKLRILKEAGVNRICINPQSMRDETLKLIGRNHGARDIERAFYDARGEGFDCINMDLIAGLPGEGREEIKFTLDKIRGLSPESITVHVLSIKRSSRINLEWEDFTHGDVSGQVMEQFEGLARELFMSPYYLYRQKQMVGSLENIGYAKAGAECIYNILIMGEFHDIVALGSGSVSKLLREGQKPLRIPNVKDVDTYIGRIDEMIERKLKWL